jgi:hypothetical protein
MALKRYAKDFSSPDLALIEIQIFCPQNSVQAMNQMFSMSYHLHFVHLCKVINVLLLCFRARVALWENIISLSVVGVGKPYCRCFPVVSF